MAPASNAEPTTVDVTPFDIGAIDLVKTFDVEIYAPNGKKTSIVITVESYGGEKVKAVRRAQQNKRLKKGMRQRKVTSEELEEETIEIACAAIVGWKNIALDGVVLEFTPANVRKLVTDPKFGWIVKQVDEAAEDDSNFIKA